MSYSELMEYGEDALGAGDFKRAAMYFGYIAAGTTEDADRCSALWKQAIALRLDGNFPEAERLFGEATELAGEQSVVVHQITRDLVMGWIDQGGDILAVKAEDAEHALIVSRDTLRAEGERGEAAASEGFLGRLYFELGRRDEAFEALLRAHYDLKDYPVYRLNNLPWLARVSWPHRWLYAPLAFRLAFKCRQSRRYKEYIVLLMGGDRLYRKLNKRR